MGSDPNFDDSKNPFTNQSYRRWFLGTTFHSLSIGLILSITLASLLLSGRADIAGIILTGYATIEIIASIISGNYSDYFSRKKIIIGSMVVSLTANLLIALCLLLWALNSLPVAGLPIFIALVLLSAVGYGFSDPALDGSLKSIILHDQFPRAMSAAQVRSSTISIIGNPLSGMLFSLAPSAPFIAKAFSETSFILSIDRIKDSLGPDVNLKNTPTIVDTFRYIFKNYKEAYAFIKTELAIKRILLCAPLLNLMVFSTSTWTALKLSDEGANGFSIGVVLTGFALGSILGGFIAPKITDSFPAGKVAIVGLSIMTFFYLIYYISAPNRAMMLLMAVFCMLPSPALNAGLFSHVFSATPVNLQGRVHALFTAIGDLGAMFGPMLAGFSVAYEAGSLFVIFILITACLGLLLLITSKAVRSLR